MIDVDDVSEMGHGLIAQAKYGRLDKMIELMDEGAHLSPVKEHVLVASAKAGHLDIVEYLEERYGEDLYEEYTKAKVFSDAATKGKNNILEHYVEKGFDVRAHGGNALVESARSGELSTVEYLINNGVDVRENENSAIKWAAYHGQLKSVNLLAEHGADIKVALQHGTQEVKDSVAEAERKKFVERLKRTVPQAKKENQNKLKI